MTVPNTHCWKPAPSTQRMLQPPMCHVRTCPQEFFVILRTNENNHPPCHRPRGREALPVLQESACPHETKIKSLSPRFCIPGPLPFCAKTRKSRIPAFPQNPVKWLPTRACGENPIFRRPAQSAHARTIQRKRRQRRETGTGKHTRHRLVCYLYARRTARRSTRWRITSSMRHLADRSSTTSS